MEISFTFQAKECVDAKRADAFHYQPDFLEIQERVSQANKVSSLTAVAPRSQATLNPMAAPQKKFTYVAIDDIDIGIGEIVKSSRILGARAPSRARKIMPQGSILISTVRPNRRAIALVPDTLANAVCSTGFAVIVPQQEQVNRLFLWAFLRCRYGARQIERYGRGASYPALLEHELKKVIVPILDEQIQSDTIQRVSHLIELERLAEVAWKEALVVLERYLPPSILRRTEVSAIHTARESRIERRADPRFFDQRHQALMSSIEETAKNSQAALRPIQEIGEPLHRGTQPPVASDGTVPVLMTKDVQNKKIQWGACRRITEEFYQEHPRGQVKRGDIVITSTGIGSWGRAAIVDGERAFADSHLTILKVDPEIVDPYVVTAFLWSEYGRMQFEQRVRGSTRQMEIYTQDIEKIRVLIPSNDDQMYIRTRIERNFVLLDEAERMRQQVIENLETAVRGVV